jgi:hypothetical protein
MRLMDSLDVVNIRNVDPSVSRRFRVLAAELALSQADTLEWLIHKANVWTPSTQSAPNNGNGAAIGETPTSEPVAS